jgi:2,4-diaminopentanoate dehydrogenase
MIKVAIYGAGQLGTGVARILKRVGVHDLYGPFKRDQRSQALSSGADVVVIATTTRLRDVADDIELAVRSGSNVLVSAEECAYPFVVDSEIASHLNALALANNVSIAGCGVNPGLIFDALVLTVLGAAPEGCVIEVSRTVDISGFGARVLRRIGVGRTAGQFETEVAQGEILGHAGFPQSMAVVASAIGLKIDAIKKDLRPIISQTSIDLSGRFTIAPGESAGVDQTYTAYVAGEEWYTCRWFGHVALGSTSRAAADVIALLRGGVEIQRLEIRPAIGAQVGSQHMVANSVARIVKAPAGWITVADMEPARPPKNCASPS